MRVLGFLILAMVNFWIAKFFQPEGCAAIAYMLWSVLAGLAYGFFVGFSKEGK